jgi:hypothetical protein
LSIIRLVTPSKSIRRAVCCQLWANKQRRQPVAAAVSPIQLHPHPCESRLQLAGTILHNIK